MPQSVDSGSRKRSIRWCEKHKMPNINVKCVYICNKKTETIY